jgi:hypothetical protein
MLFRPNSSKSRTFATTGTRIGTVIGAIVTIHVIATIITVGIGITGTTAQACLLQRSV